MRRQSFYQLVLCLATPTALWAQTPPPTTVPAGLTLTTENARAVTGVRLDARPDGSIWFLLPSNDRIVQLQSDGLTMKQWQIRDDKALGANPVDFEIDGNLVWFIETGESQIEAGQSVLARLNTSTGELREWIVPGSRPAGFYRAPDGKVWIPQTNARLQSLDLETRDVVDYRSTKTFAYSDLAIGADGALWMADFGNNRIVRYQPGSTTETSWTLPDTFRINSTQIQFDDQGNLWICELTANRMDRFSPATGELTAFTGLDSPLHFDIFAGRIYVAEDPSGNGRVAVLDPTYAGGFRVTLTAETLDVGSVKNRSQATIRDKTVTPTVFTSKSEAIANAELKVSAGAAGILRTEFPLKIAWGITVSGGVIWVGSDGRLVRLVLQTIGSASDFTVPLAAQFGVAPGPRIEIESTLWNRGTAPISGEALYLYSPGAFAARTSFTLGPGETLFLPDTFRDTSTNSAVSFGPVRFRITSGVASDLAASVRSARLRDDGTSFGFAFPAFAGSEALAPGPSRTLFTGGRGGPEVSVFGFYSPAGTDATATLVAPDGTVRGTRRFSAAANVAQEFNPAASAFGVPSQPGDTIRVSVNSGSLEPYVNLFDTGTTDVAVSLPVSPTRDAVIPNLGTLAVGETSFVSDLFLANADPANPAQATVSFTPLGSTGAPTSVSLTLPPGGSRVIENVLSTLFAVSSGQGTLLVGSDVPVAVSYRLASRRPEGDYSAFAAALDGADAIPDGGAAFAFGVPQTATRRTHLLLYNRGAAGTVTVIGYDAKGEQVGRVSASVGDHQAARINSVMEQFGVADQSANRIRIETTPGMRLYAQTAEVDAGTGDIEIARLR